MISQAVLGGGGGVVLLLQCGVEDTMARSDTDTRVVTMRRLSVDTGHCTWWDVITTLQHKDNTEVRSEK